MTYGEIIEPMTTRAALGQFICGEAVTRAAKLEQRGKGSRIFIDLEIGGRHFSKISPRTFVNMTNAADFTIVDEFTWFSSFDHIENRQQKISRLSHIISLLGNFRHSPKFRWNAASLQGRVHLGATIERLSYAANALANDLNVEAPHFATTTSENYQNSYDPDQYCESRREVFIKNKSRWIRELKSVGISHHSDKDSL